MSDSQNRTVLHGWHESHGGKMVDFAGWSMPVQYGTGIIAEHLATRRGAGLFDVSHMGRYRVTGPGAESFLLETLTNNASGLDSWQAQYTFIANESGGAVDDAYLYRLAGEDGIRPGRLQHRLQELFRTPGEGRLIQRAEDL